MIRKIFFFLMLSLSASAASLRGLSGSKTGRSFNSSVVQRLQDSSGRSRDKFGQSVALQNDIIVVGAPEVDDSAAARDCGRIFIYKRNEYDSEIWDEIREIEDGYPGDFFGFSVALHTDYTLIVGAPRSEGEGYALSGVAYYLTVNPDPYGTQMEAIELPVLHVLDANSFFGHSVAIGSGPSGVVTAAIGAYGSEGSGAVYIYRREKGEWSSKIEELIPSDGSSKDYFGFSVSMLGDTLAIGAPQNRNYGAVYVFQSSGSSYAELIKLQQTWSSNDDEDNPLRGDFFGASVSIGGDYIAVGSPYNDVKSSNAGAVFIYEDTGSGFIFKQSIFGTGISGQRYGFSVAIDPVYNRLAVGSDMASAYKAGEVDVYVVSANGYYEEEARKLPTQYNHDEESDAEFGEAVAIYDDTLVVGAAQGYGRSRRTGDVYVYTARTPQEIKDYYSGGVYGEDNKDGISAMTLFLMVFSFSIFIALGLMYSRYTVVGDKQGFGLYLSEQTAECCGCVSGSDPRTPGIVVPEDSSHSNHPMLSSGKMSKISRSPMDDSDGAGERGTGGGVRTVGGVKYDKVDADRGKSKAGGRSAKKYAAHDDI